MRFKSLFAMAALTVGATALPAQTIMPPNNSNPVQVPGIDQYQTDFNTVGGMQVSWTLTGACAPGACTATWGDISDASGIAGAWGVWTNDFKLWGAGGQDTYDNNAWNLWGMNITSFTLVGAIDPAYGTGIFDMKTCDNSGCSTENSATGKPFEWDNDVNSRVTYSNPIEVPPAGFVGDLYGTLKVEFGYMTCPSGYDEHNGTCRDFTGYTYSCPQGATLGTGSRADECKYSWSGWFSATKTSNYVYADKVWKTSAFGQSGNCRGSEDPESKKTNGNQSGRYNNYECFNEFTQDMDNVDLNPGGGPQEVVPEPATMTLLATGLAGMAAARRRKQAAK